MKKRQKNIHTGVIIIGLIFLFGICELFGGVNVLQVFNEYNDTYFNKFGISVSGIGDVNGDNYDDVIVGSNGWGGDGSGDLPPGFACYGRVYIYYGGSSMDNNADLIMSGTGENDCFYLVSGAGDVNGDNYDDVIVGAGCAYYEAVFIYFGGSPMDDIADVIVSNDDVPWSGGNWCADVSGAGDLNGDGYDDVIVGGTNGTVWIFYGGSSMDNQPDLVISRWQQGRSMFGRNVSGAGDVNGDSYDDVIVGDRYPPSDSRAYIFFGGNPMDDISDVTMIGNEFYYSQDVSGVGDVNGDNYDDVIVGAANHYNSPDPSRAYIYFGGSSMNGTADVILTGKGLGTRFGRSLSGAGDINQDNYDDVIVGSYNYQPDAGRVYIYHGGSSMDNVADIILDDDGNGTYFGQNSCIDVDCAGDVDNDGCVEMIVGNAGNYPYDGIAYVFKFVTPNEPPVADAGPDLTIIVGEKVHLDGSGSYDPDGTIESYTWDLGDGSPNALGMVVDHNYAIAGTYTAILTVMDNANAESSDDIIVTVISHDEAVTELISYIDEIDLPNGLTNSLSSKLLNVLQSLNISKINTAINQLNAFINQVKAQRGKQISAGDADALITYTKRIIDALEEEYGLAKRLTRGYTGENPKEYCLFQNHPNPFNTETTISYTIPEDSPVSVEVYSIRGERIAILLNSVQDAGYHSVAWDGKDNLGRQVSGGLYLCRIRAGTCTQTIRMLLMK